MDVNHFLQLAGRKRELYLYEESLFRFRLQEEMVRADLSGQSWCLADFPLDRLQSFCPEHLKLVQFWDFFLEELSVLARGSDCKGILPGATNLGVVFIDTPRATGEEIVFRLIESLAEKTRWDEADKISLRREINLVVYPEDIRKTQAEN